MKAGCLLAILLCAATPLSARTVAVRDSGGLTYAVEHAKGGDVIELADGVYDVEAKIDASAQGSPAAPITVRARRPLGAHIRSDAQIAFEITGPYWQFSDLDLAGVCASDTVCEHAFHVVGETTGFSLKNSRLADFNAHVKVNADGAHHLPMQGLIEHNEFFDSHPRHTDNPVAPINIDNAGGWIVRSNLIHDFQKDGAGEGSYGAFVKGGAQSPIVERNLVFCARDRVPMGHMVGLSFGAHGMAAALCPPHWDAAQPCDPEVTGGVMRNNIVANCSDDGIYLNRAGNTAVLFNTLVRTQGAEFRFASSTGVARGNLMTGPIRGTQGGHFKDGGNATQISSPRELAAWFRAPAPKGRLINLPGPDAAVPNDYCGRSRGAEMQIGAMQAASGTCALWR